MEYNYVINKARSRTRGKNQNYMLVVVGPTGSGKSYSAIALAMMIDPDFDISRVCFRAEEFLKAASRDLDPGSVIVFDEAGIDVSSREWYTVRNKAINQTVETFRRDNLVCIWTTPVLSNIDKKSRSYFHGLAEVLDPGKVGGKSGEVWGAIKYFDLIPDVQKGGVITVYPQITDAQNRPVQVKGSNPSQPNMIIPDPRRIGRTDDESKGKKLIEKYEEKKKEFTEEIKEKGLKELHEEEEENVEDIKLEGDSLIGFISKRFDEFPFSEDLSKRELARRVYSKLQVITDDNVDFTKNEIKNVAGYIKNNSDEAKELSEDPFEEKEYEAAELNLEEMKPVFDELRDKGYSTAKIAKMWGVPQHKLYDKWRHWRAQED